MNVRWFAGITVDLKGHVTFWVRDPVTGKLIRKKA